MRTATTLIAFLILSLAPAYAAADEVVYALVIGNNDPPAASAEELGTLQYADDDAVRYFEFFESSSDHARLLTVPDAETQKLHSKIAAKARVPSLENLERVLAEFAESMAQDLKEGREPVLFFAFSGHGAHDDNGEPFLALHGTGRLTSEGIRQRIIEGLPTLYTHLIIDACHAAAVVGARGSFFEKEVESENEEATPKQKEALLSEDLRASHPNVGMLLAATAGEAAHEWSELQSGVFTHEVLSGLRGAADVNADGRVEYSELAAFVAAANRRIEDPRGVPKVIALPPRSNLRVPISVTEGRSPALVGDVSALGHFTLKLTNGRRVLDANLTDRRPVRLLLPPGQRIILTTADQEAVIEPSSSDVSVQDLALSNRQTLASRGDLANALQRGMFAAPFSEGYYHGFVDRTGAPTVDFQAVTNPQQEVVAEQTVERPQEPKRTCCRGLAIASLSVAGVSFFAATVLVPLAVTQAIYYNTIKKTGSASGIYTDQQIERSRKKRNALIWASVGTATASIGFTILGVALFPAKSSTPVSVAPMPSSHSPLGVSISTRW